MNLGKPLSVKDERWIKMRCQEKKVLSELYPDYDPNRHDAFLFRYSLEIWRRMKDIPEYVNDKLGEAENGR